MGEGASCSTAGVGVGGDAGGCALCRRRLGPAARASGRCRCGATYCPAHRPAEEHACSHDFRATQRERLERSLPRVEAPKVASI